MSAVHQRAAAALEAFALAFPQTEAAHPWGELAVKVKKKAFLFMRADAEGLSLSCKLPHSAQAALMLPFAEPTGYRLGKSGWVSARFGPGQAAPLELLKTWVDESYRAVAPVTLVKALARAAPTKAPARPKTKARGARR